MKPLLETVRRGEREWVVLDVLQREALDEVQDALRLEPWRPMTSWRVADALGA